MALDKQVLDHRRSVKSADIGKNTTGNNFLFWIANTLDGLGRLPPELPAPTPAYYGLHNNQRDTTAMSTVYHESFWGGVIGIEASKFASAGWALKSDKPRIQERFQNLLLNATVGVIAGWVPFASAGFASYANTGKWFIEIERYTSNRNSRIKAFHHLSPRRCWMTTDPEIPVIYLDRHGRYHEMKRHQVMMFVDMPDSDEETMNSPMSSVVRAYDAIVQMEAIKVHIYEKVSGRRPLALHFVQGANDKTIRSAIENAQATADSQEIQSYMGAAISGLLGDGNVNLITIPLAEIPDGIDVDQIRKYAHLEYANALGEDPTRIDPQLIGNRQLGAGAQARVLDLKARQGGVMLTLKQNFTHEVMQLLRNEKIQFAFEELDLTDDQARADVSQTRAETRKTQIESGEITAVQAANLAVDQGDLPPEFVPEDETMQDVITDAEQPAQKIDPETVKNDAELAPVENNPDDLSELLDTDKQIDPDNENELAGLIEENLETAQDVYRRLSGE